MEDLKLNKRTSKSVGQLARALYTNSPDAKNELFFLKGDILTVIEIDYDGQVGWWLCSLRGDRGLCPGNYLEMIEDKYSLAQNGNILKQRSIEALDTYDFPKEFKDSPSFSSSLIPKVNSPLPDDQPEYDVPKSPLPIYTTASLVRAKKNENNPISFLSDGSIKSKRVSSASSSTSSSGISAKSFDCPSSSSTSSENNIYANEQASIFTRNNFVRSSRSVNSLRSCISVSTDNVDSTPEYDVPRPSLSVKASSNLSGSRPGSSMSLTTTKPLQASESRDSGLDMYDVPRSVKDCLNIFECKYDTVQKRRHISGASIPSAVNAMKRSSICSSNGSSCNDCSTHSSNDSNPVTRRFGIILRSRSPAVNKSDSLISSTGEIYDVPPPASAGTSRSPSIRSQLQDCVYDLPAETRQLSLCGSTETLSCSESYHESFDKRESNTSLLKRISSNSTINNPSHFNSVTNNFSLPLEVKLLPLCPKAAVSVCEKLRQEVITAIQSLLNFVRPKWRVEDNLKEIMPELRFTCVRLNLALKDLNEFCTRTVSNAKHLEIDSLVLRLRKLVAPLTNGSQIVQKDIDELEAYLWSVYRLSQSSNEAEDSSDALDQLVMCARSLQHDATEIANFIALNSSALFKDNEGSSSRASNASIPNIPAMVPSSSQPILDSVALQQAQVVEDGEDYDYVTLVTAEDKVKPEDPLPPVNSVPVDIPCTLNSRDQQLLEFYSAQIGTIAPILSQSISTFISSVHANDPPKIFNGHLKYVILLAYKMLFAGDTIHKNISSDITIKSNIELQSDQLHKAVISLHEASKIASRDFPKILPMQKIVDHVWETTSAATKLKKVIFNACL